MKTSRREPRVILRSNMFLLMDCDVQHTYRSETCNLYDSPHLGCLRASLRVVRPRGIRRARRSLTNAPESALRDRHERDPLDLFLYALIRSNTFHEQKRT